MQIAVLYIALGKYDIFFKNFYASAQKLFIPEAEKHYFVFTDSKNKGLFSKKNVTVIPHKNMGWPNNTLKRFELFCSIEEQLNAYDYAFFFNANMEFVAPITTQFLPDNGLLCVTHPGYYNSCREKFPYDTNPIPPPASCQTRVRCTFVAV